MTTENGMKSKFQCLYSFIGIPCVYLSIFYDCFHASTAELSSFKRNYMTAKLKIFTIWCFIKNVCGLLV